MMVRGRLLGIEPEVDPGRDLERERAGVGIRLVDVAARDLDQLPE